MIDNDILNDNSYWLVINYKYERDKIIIKRNWNNNLPIVGIFEKKNSINLWISIILNFFNNKIPRHQSFPKLIEFLDICPKNCSQIRPLVFQARAISKSRFTLQIVALVCEQAMKIS